MKKARFWRWFVQLKFTDTGEVDREIDLPNDGSLWMDCVYSFYDAGKDHWQNPDIRRRDGDLALSKIDKAARTPDGCQLCRYEIDDREKSVTLFYRRYYE